jgi:hypothetical protein
MATSAKRRQLAEPWAANRNAAIEEERKAAFGADLRKSYLIDYDSGLLDATTLATKCWYITHSGGRGVEDLMVNPNTSSRHASEHIERILQREFPPPPVRKVLVPATPKRSAIREESYTVDVQLPSTLLVEEMQDHVEPFGDDPTGLIALFQSHPIIAAAKVEAPRPHWSRLRTATLYWDDVAYTKRDKFFGLFLYSFLSGRHHLLFCLRRHDMCHCGCRGWCTLWPLLDAIVTDINGFQSEIARWAFLFTKGDWPAFTDIAGVRQWSHATWPCYECCCAKDEMKTMDFFQRSTIDDGPFATYTVDLWEEDRDRCRIDVCVLTPEMHSDLKRALRYRKKFIGRGLKEHLDAYSLRRGDRLEPTKGLPDVAQFESMVPPFWVVFWRCTDEDRLIHESPLFTIPGLSVQSQGPDVLHYWALGPVAAFVALVIWWLITTPLFAVKVEGLSTEDETRLALFKIRSKLWKYYKIKRSDEHFRRKGSEVWNLTEKMLGARKRPMLHAKAAEVRGLLDFCVELLSESLPQFQGTPDFERCQLLIACGTTCRDCDRLLRGTGLSTMPETDRQKLFSTYVRHVSLFNRAGGVFLPKHHMMMHLIWKTGTMGHPSLWATFRDESLNGVVARIARSCHRAAFNQAVHIKFKRLQALVGNSALQMS